MSSAELLKEVLKQYRLSDDDKTSLKKLINAKIKQDGLHIILKKINGDYIAEIEGTEQFCKYNIGVTLMEIMSVLSAIRYT